LRASASSIGVMLRLAGCRQKAQRLPFPGSTGFGGDGCLIFFASSIGCLGKFVARFESPAGFLAESVSAFLELGATLVRLAAELCVVAAEL
jgi:hypothetical protein